MKRWMIAALALGVSLSLCACGDIQEAAEAETNMQPLEPAVEEIAASESSAAEIPEIPASDTDAAPAVTVVPGEDYERARECIGLSVDELIAALGEPESRQYASSCETENAEDGMLFYEGFYVWTLRTDESELVRDVYLDE